MSVEGLSQGHWNQTLQGLKPDPHSPRPPTYLELGCRYLHAFEIQGHQLCSRLEGKKEEIDTWGLTTLKQLPVQKSGLRFFLRASLPSVLSPAGRLTLGAEASSHSSSSIVSLGTKGCSCWFHEPTSLRHLLLTCTKRFSPCSLLDPSSPGNSQDYSKKEERAGQTRLAFVFGHFSQLDSLPNDSKIWSLSELPHDSSCHPGFCTMASVRLGINNCEWLSWKLSPKKNIHSYTIQTSEDKNRPTPPPKKKTRNLQQMIGLEIQRTSWGLILHLPCIPAQRHGVQWGEGWISIHPINQLRILYHPRPSPAPPCPYPSPLSILPV